MSATEILEQIRRLPPGERQEIVEKIREEFGQYDDELTREQIAELERRAQEMREHPDRGIPWERVQSELYDRLKRREA